MRHLAFEMKKFKEMRLWFLFLLIQILVISSLGIFHYLNPVDMRQREMNTANAIRADFAFQISAMRYDLRGRPMAEENLFTPEEQEIFDLVNQGERARFIYAAEVWDEDWHLMNPAKQEIWEILIELRDLGQPIRAADANRLEIEKFRLDWLVEEGVDYLDDTQTHESAFLLNNSFDILLSLPLIFLLIFFFAVPIFEENFTHRFNFNRVLPIKRRVVFMNKISLFLLILLSFVGISILAVCVMGLFLDEIPLLTQLRYPMGVDSIFGFHVKSLAEILLWRIGFFFVLSLVLFFIIYILSAFVSNLANNTIVIGFLTMISMIIVQSDPINYQIWNPLAWLDSSNFILLHHRNVVIILFIAMILLSLILGYLVINLLRWVKRSRTSSQLRGIKHINKMFLFKFEWLKFSRDKSLLYVMSALLILGVYMGTSGYQAYQDRFIDFEEKIALTIEELERSIEGSEEIIAEFERETQSGTTDSMMIAQLNYDSFMNYLAIYEAEIEKYYAILEGDMELMKELEGEILQNDLNFVMNQLEEDSNMLFTTIPMAANIFVPNAYINLALNEWKEENQVPFVLPGGPYATEFIPGFEESPRSGENQPPMNIDYQAFVNYLEAREQSHNQLSGFNLSVDLLNENLYLLLWLLMIVFFSISYVKEWDGYQTIRFAKVQPVSIKKIFNVKNRTSQTATVCMILVAFLLVFLIGTVLNGVRHLEFPYVRYIPKSVGDAMRESEWLYRIPTVNQYFTIIPLWRYLLEGAGLLLLGSIFINQIIYFISLFVKRRWMVTGLTVLLLLLGYGISSMYTQAWMQFFPFIYLNIPDILTGTTALHMDYTYMTPYIGMLILLIFIIIFEGVNRLVIRKDENRDIR